MFELSLLIERLWFVELLDAVNVETDEASEELQSVLEVLLLLVHGSISNQSFLVGQGHNHPILN